MFFTFQIRLPLGSLSLLTFEFTIQQEPYIVHKNQSLNVCIPSLFVISAISLLE